MSKTLETAMVLRVEDGMITESYVFVGDDSEKVNRLAEDKFKVVCKTSIPKKDGVNLKRDMELFLEDGCVIYGGGKNSIQLHHSDSTLILPQSRKVPSEPGYICKDGIFIIQPNGLEKQDKLYQICRATADGSLGLDIYPNDKYEEISCRMSLKAAKEFVATKLGCKNSKVATKLGCKNPKVI